MYAADTKCTCHTFCTDPLENVRAIHLYGAHSKMYRVVMPAGRCPLTQAELVRYHACTHAYARDFLAEWGAGV